MRSRSLASFVSIAEIVATEVEQSNVIVKLNVAGLDNQGQGIYIHD